MFEQVSIYICFTKSEVKVYNFRLVGGNVLFWFYMSTISYLLVMMLGCVVTQSNFYQNLVKMSDFYKAHFVLGIEMIINRSYRFRGYLRDLISNIDQEI